MGRKPLRRLLRFRGDGLDSWKSQKTRQRSTEKFFQISITDTLLVIIRQILRRMGNCESSDSRSKVTLNLVFTDATHIQLRSLKQIEANSSLAEAPLFILGIAD